MPRLDESTAECLVFTGKYGLLSAIAHDLQLRVGRFAIDVDESRRTVGARSRFDAGSLRVVCAMERGVEAPTSGSVRTPRCSAPSA